MKINFTKMSGAGNDFILIDNRSLIIKNGEQLAKKVCDRHWGIGADGLLLVERSKKADYKMMYYNSDGSYGGMCGNGGRCIAMFSYCNGIANRKHKFEALDYLYIASVNEKKVSLTMKNPVDLMLDQIIYIENKKIKFHCINTGSPHIVIDAKQLSVKKGLDGIDVHALGKKLRWDKRFLPDGTNVNFINVQKNNTVYVRTYERGVEGETLACGTGSIASAIIAYRKHNLTPPIKVIPRSNVPLKILFDATNDLIKNVRLIGPAITIFNGTIDV